MAGYQRPPDFGLEYATSIGLEAAPLLGDTLLRLALPIAFLVGLPYAATVLLHRVGQWKLIPLRKLFLAVLVNQVFLAAGIGLSVYLHKDTYSDIYFGEFPGAGESAMFNIALVLLLLALAIVANRLILKSGWLKAVILTPFLVLVMAAVTLFMSWLY